MKKITRKTGLSLAIQNTLISIENDQTVANKAKPVEFKIKVANTMEERESVFQLAYQIYLEKGYIKANPQKWLVQNYDAQQETIILLVQDQKKRVAGSLTLVFNEIHKLPAEKIYRDEINILKTKGEKMVEISRLVISHEYRNSKEVLLLLINYLMIYAYHIKKYDNLVIEVNPRHKNYYKMLLNFEEIGVEKACPNVQNAPAVLLYLPLSYYQSEVNRFSNTLEKNQKERSLYSHFIKPEQEKLVAHYLKNQFRPMASLEKIHFGFTESGNYHAVSI